MAFIPVEQPPTEFSDIQREYLNRMVLNINLAFASVYKLPILYTLEEKPLIGKVYYYGAAIATTAITSEGFWGYTSGGWSKLG